MKLKFSNSENNIFFKLITRLVHFFVVTESAVYRLEGGWIGDFYEMLQNMVVSKTNDKLKPISMQRKVDYTR